MLKLLETTGGVLKALERPAPKDECPACGTRPCKIANPDRGQEARIGELAIGRYRIGLPLSHLKCAQTRKILL